MSTVFQPLRYRMFWNWDHSTNWLLNQIGAQNTGVANHYTKASGVFEQDYRRIVDWAALHGIDAIGVVGLLRDSHGGFDSARRICAYAREKGVRIYLIAGLYAYGGIYHEGASYLSLDRFLERNPDCVARLLDGTPHYCQYDYPYGYKSVGHACPSNPTVNNFVLDSLDRVFRHIPELGGVQMETGDSGSVCLCERCRERRAAMGAKEEGRTPAFSFTDMACIYPQAAKAVWDISPDALVICETYSHFLNRPVFYDADTPAMKAMLELPEKAFFQWSVSVRFDWSKWTEEVRVPEHLRKYHNVVRVHHATQWAKARHHLAIDKIRLQCRLTSAAGMDGVSMFGESSPFHANNEFNYLALQYFAAHPDAPLAAFQKDVMAPLLGGEANAEAYTEYADQVTAGPEQLSRAVDGVMRILPGISGTDEKRRWIWLAQFLNSALWEAKPAH